MGKECDYLIYIPRYSGIPSRVPFTLDVTWHIPSPDAARLLLELFATFRLHIGRTRPLIVRFFLVRVVSHLSFILKTSHPKTIVQSSLASYSSSHAERTPAQNAV